MKLNISLLGALLCLILSCTPSGSTHNTGISKPVEINYAHHFRLERHSDYVALHILQPETGKIAQSYALVKRHKDVGIPEGFTRIEIPVRHMAVLSTTHIGMLNELNALHVIGATTSGSLIANKKVAQKIQSGEITSFPDEASVTPEKLLSGNISVVMYSGFGKEFPNEEKLRQIGIFPMANYDWREEHPLGKAEWIKVFGFLTGHEEEAMTAFAGIEARYFELKQAIEAGTKHTSPSVLVGSLIGDIWYAPAGNSYMAHLLRDAGAHYLYANEKGTGSCEKSMEQVYKDQQRTPIWINAGAVTLNDLKAQQSRYALFDAFQHGKVYCYTHNSNYFWEMGAVHPDWMLQDFAVITGTLPEKPLYFYSQLK